MVDLDPVVSWMLVLWLTLFGACIGSFLNVVVYRLPLGKSLSDPPSHCPKCGHAIRWYDNVPVFGWLFLGGKCRDCKEPISVRYPLIEATCGIVFGSIAGATVHRGGDASLPEFFCLVLSLSGLVVTLLAAGLIEMDGRKVPWRLFIPAVLMGPMMPWLMQDSFHIPWLVHLKVGMLPITGIWIIAEMFMPGMISLASKMKDLSETVSSQHVLAFCSGALIGLYLGSRGSIVVFLSLLLFIFFFFAHLITLRKLVSYYVILSIVTFAFILTTLFCSFFSTLTDPPFRMF